MRWASASALFGLVLLSGCGLFRREPKLPPPAAVAAARAGDAAEWELLRDAALRYQELGPAARPELRALAALHPESLRLAALVQDVEIEQEGRAAVLRRYQEQAAAQPGAVAFYLAARACAERELGLQWVERALQEDPDLVPAQVLRLGFSARAGENETLNSLVELLRRHPESAEGWRLLARLAPLYGRGDLARAAAQTEPWSPLDPPRWAKLAQADAALRDGDPQAALRILADFPSRDRDAGLLQAAALTAAQRPAEALTVLDDLAAANPGDAMVRFNRGLLALDYLRDEGLAQQELTEFLRLADAGVSVPLNRRLQAELWLRRLAQAPGGPR